MVVINDGDLLYSVWDIGYSGTLKSQIICHRDRLGNFIELIDLIAFNDSQAPISTGTHHITEISDVNWNSFNDTIYVVWSSSGINGGTRSKLQTLARDGTASTISQYSLIELSSSGYLVSRIGGNLLNLGYQKQSGGAVGNQDLIIAPSGDFTRFYQLSPSGPILNFIDINATTMINTATTIPSIFDDDIIYMIGSTDGNLTTVIARYSISGNSISIVSPSLSISSEFYRGLVERSDGHFFVCTGVPSNGSNILKEMDESFQVIQQRTFANHTVLPYGMAFSTDEQYLFAKAVDASDESIYRLNVFDLSIDTVFTDGQSSGNLGGFTHVVRVGPTIPSGGRRRLAYGTIA